MRRSMTTLVAMLGLVAGASACAPDYDGFDCRMINETPSGAFCSDQMIEVARGEALVVRVRPHSDNRNDYEDPSVELRSSDPQLLDVRPGVGDDFTLIGLTLGETSVELWIDGELMDEVSARIVAAEPSAAND